MKVSRQAKVVPTTLLGWAIALLAVFVLDTIVSGRVLSRLFGATTSLRFAWAFLHGEAARDSWGPMMDALDELHRSKTARLYSQLFFQQGEKFQYPPSSLIFVDGLARASGLSGEPLVALLNRISRCEVVLVAVVAWQLFLDALKDGWPAPLPDLKAWGPRALSLGAWIALAIGSYPIARGYWLGQAQTTITLLVACALLAWERGRPRLAGLLLGLCCCMKPQWAIVCLWAAVRREWALAWSAAAAIAAVSLAACVAYGPQQYLDYLPVISFLSQHGESFVANQSMNGLLNRILMNGTNMAWEGSEFPPFNRLVYASTLATSVVILGGALLWRRRRKATTLDLALAVLSLTTASPIAWEHHYGFLLAVFAVLVPYAVAARPFGRLTVAYLGAAFFLTTQRLDDLMKGIAETHANFLQSYMYFGVIMVLVALYRVSATLSEKRAIEPAAGARLDPRLLRAKMRELWHLVPSARDVAAWCKRAYGRSVDVLARSAQRPRSLHLAALVLQCAALFDFAGPWPEIHGFPLDDAWIHQVVARTFAQTGTLGYVPGQHGAGATSYLWAALLATNYRWFHADPVAFTLAANVVASLVAGQALLAVVLGARPSDATRFRWSLQALVSVALATFGGNFLWYAFSGMEAALVGALSLAGIFFWTRERGSRSATALAAGAVAGLLALTRPDAAPFGLLLAASTPLVGRRWRDAPKLLAPWALGLGVYLGSNLLETGTILPATLSGRKWLWAPESSGLTRVELLWDFATVWILRLRNYTLGTSSNEALWIGMGLALHSAVQLLKARRPGPLLVLAWSLAHLATFAVMLPSPGHGGRYQPLSPLVWLWLVGMGSFELLESLARLLTRLATKRGSTEVPGWASALTAVAAITPWAALVGVGVRDWRHDEGMAVRHIRETELGLGAIVNALPPEARVASFDIGGVGFASSRPIIDAGGLSDSRSAALLQRGRMWQYLRDQRVDYVILPVAYREDDPSTQNFGFRLGLFGNPAVVLEPVRALESPLFVWGPSIASTWNASPRQELFRVRYTGVDTTSVYQGHSAHPPFRDDEHRTTWRDRAMLDRDLSLLASLGTPVSLAVSRFPPQGSKDGPAWMVALGRWGVSAKAPTESRVPNDAVRSVVAERCKPYLDLSDYGGAALAALRAVAEVQQDFDPRTTLPALPPIRSPVPGGPVNEVEEHLLAGLVLLVLFASLGRLLSVLADARAPSRAAPAAR